jgi:hypothetical protein
VLTDIDYFTVNDCFGRARIRAIASGRAGSKIASPFQGRSGALYNLSCRIIVDIDFTQPLRSTVIVRTGEIKRIIVHTVGSEQFYADTKKGPTENSQYGSHLS